jgi:hypothetical protein
MMCGEGKIETLEPNPETAAAHVDFCNVQGYSKLTTKGP